MAKLIVNDNDLVDFYKKMIIQCDKVDKCKDKFQAMGMMEEIETLIEGVNSTVSHERRSNAMDVAFFGTNPW